MNKNISEEKYAVAIDVGGTKIDAVLVASDGRIVNRVRTRGGIPFDCGVESTLLNCFGAIDALLDKREEKPCALYASIATVEYYYEEFMKAFRERFDIEKIRIEGDGCALISACFGHRDGACVICGTGSSLYTRQGERYSHIGGGGHLIDSCGSGFSLGRLALQSCLRASDQSSSPTLICELIERKTGGRPWERLPEVYEGGRAYVASFAEYVFSARLLGDVVARRIFNTCAADIADVIWAARKNMGEGLNIVLNGGIFTNFPEYADAVKALAPADVSFFVGSTPPVYGCAVEAMHDLGVKFTDAERERFCADYERLK